MKAKRQNSWLFCISFSFAFNQLAIYHFTRLNQNKVPESKENIQKNPNLFLFYGDNNYNAHKEMTRWENAFVQKHGDFNIQIYDDGELDYSELKNAVQTLPFAAEKRLVIIKNYMAQSSNDDQQKTAALLENLPEHCVLLFIERQKPDARTTLYKRLNTIGQLKEFKALDPSELVQWIATESPKKGLNIKSQQAQTIANLVGSDLWQLDQELEKLAIYSQTEPLTEQVTENLISPNLSSSIFKLTDAVASKRLKNAIEILSTLITSGEDLFQIFYMIARQFRLLIQIKACDKENMTSDKIAKKLKEKPFTITTHLNQCKNFNEKQLHNIFEQLLNIDIAIKSGKIRTTTDDQTELRLALEKLIVSICRK